MDLSVYNTLILSDLHLGAETSRAHEATQVLKKLRFHKLILLGDIFADLNFARLTKDHWKFLGYIRKLSNPKRNIEVVWVEGNHDHGLTDVMSHLVGVRVYQDYEWEFAGLRHVAIHGHQFDGFQVSNVTLSKFGTALYLKLQKLDFKRKPIVRMIDRLNTRWLRMSSKVSAGALQYARQRDADRIFCGHTHQAVHIAQDGIDYYNTGGWVDSRLTYLTVDKQGVRIHEFNEHEFDEHTFEDQEFDELGSQERVDNRYPSQERGEAASSPADLADETRLFEDVEYEGINR